MLFVLFEYLLFSLGKMISFQVVEPK